MMLHVKMDRTSVKILILLGTLAAACTGQGLVNVALGKTVSLSSSYHPYWPSGNVVNGNTNGTYDETNCIQTAYQVQSGPVQRQRSQEDKSPWLQVDLGRNYPVFKMTLYHRLYQQYTVIPATILVDNQTCFRYDTHFPFRDAAFSCSTTNYGQTVTIQRDVKQATFTLDLCEIQVWVCQSGYSGDSCTTPCAITHCAYCDQYKEALCYDCDDGYFGPSCSKCGHCTGGSACDKVTGQCPRECQAGGQGTQCNVSTENRDNLPTKPEISTDVGPLVGAVVGGFALLALVVVVSVTIYLKRKRTRRSSTSDQSELLHGNTPRVAPQLNKENDPIENPDEPRSPKDEGSNYDEIIERRNFYDSLQPLDQRPNERPVYTSPVFKNASATAGAPDYSASGSTKGRNPYDSLQPLDQRPDERSAYITPVFKNASVTTGAPDHSASESREGRNRYDSLQPVDQRPDEQSVYTTPIFKNIPEATGALVYYSHKGSSSDSEESDGNYCQAVKAPQEQFH